MRKRDLYVVENITLYLLLITYKFNDLSIAYDCFQTQRLS